jgi:hypothetical protein
VLKFINKEKKVVMTEDDDGNLTIIGEITTLEDKLKKEKEKEEKKGD